MRVRVGEHARAGNGRADAPVVTIASLTVGAFMPPTASRTFFFAAPRRRKNGGRQPACVQKNKNPSKIQGCPMRSSSAGAEMLADKERPQRILCVFSRALTQYEGISARQNRVCPCQSQKKEEPPTPKKKGEEGGVEGGRSLWMLRSEGGGAPGDSLFFLIKRKASPLYRTPTF